MKKLGLIGGIGPESTIPYYKKIVFGVQKKSGRKQFPKLTIESLDVFQILHYCQQKDYAGLIQYISEGIHNLAATGCDFAAMTGNTPHIVFDQLQDRSPIPLISMPVTTCQAACRAGYKTLGLLGTAVTMQEDFFKVPFQRAHITMITPDKTEISYIHHKISSELELGIIKNDTKAAFLRIIQRLKEENHIDGIVLGCTELPLAFQGVQTPVPVLDTMAIHIEALIDMIMGDLPIKPIDKQGISV